MSFKKMLLVGMFAVFIGEQCSGAGVARPDFLDEQDELLEDCELAVDFSNWRGVPSLDEKLAGITDAQDEKNRRLLHEAKKGNVTEVRRLLDQKADLDVIDEYGEAAVNLAAYMGNAEMVALLVIKGASISAVDVERIMLSVRNGEKDKMAKFLIKTYYDALINKINKRPMICSWIENHGLINENYLKFSNEILEIIAGYLSPCDLASFGRASRDLRVSAGRPFEKVRKIMVLQSKEKLKLCITTLLNKIVEIDINRSGYFDRYGGVRDDRAKAIQRSKKELKRAEALDENALLRGEVMCQGHRRDLKSGKWS